MIQEEVMAEESTDGEVETQVYNQDSQDSIGEVSKTYLNKLLLLVNEMSFDKLKYYLDFCFQFAASMFNEILLELPMQFLLYF